MSLIIDYNISSACNVVCMDDKEYFRDLQGLFFPSISYAMIDAYLEVPKSRDEERFIVPYEAIRMFDLRPHSKTSDILHDIITNGLRCKVDYVIRKRNNKRRFFLSAQGLRKYLFGMLDEKTKEQLLILENMEYYYYRYLMQLNLVCLKRSYCIPESLQEQVVRLIGSYHLKYTSRSVPKTTNDIVDKCLEK